MFKQQFKDYLRKIIKSYDTGINKITQLMTFLKLNFDKISDAEFEEIIRPLGQDAREDDWLVKKNRSYKDPYYNSSEDYPTILRK